MTATTLAFQIAGLSNSAAVEAQRDLAIDHFSNCAESELIDADGGTPAEIAQNAKLSFNAQADEDSLDSVKTRLEQDKEFLSIHASPVYGPAEDENYIFEFDSLLLEMIFAIVADDVRGKGGFLFEDDALPFEERTDCSIFRGAFREDPDKPEDPKQYQCTAASGSEYPTDTIQWGQCENFSVKLIEDISELLARAKYLKQLLILENYFAHINARIPNREEGEVRDLQRNLFRFLNMIYETAETRDIQGEIYRLTTEVRREINEVYLEKIAR